jgi:hypothetical protein
MRRSFASTAALRLWTPVFLFFDFSNSRFRWSKSIFEMS